MRLFYYAGATYTAIEGLEIASSTSRYRKILFGIQKNRNYDDWAQKCHGKD